MYLKRLEIHGFKSFAQKTVLEFDKGIIAIVGPNGSGKSNVADSLRWVLGEQSSKLMRGKKADDVIFAGSDKKARLGFAEVFATFDNRGRRIPVDSAEVSIGRRVDRSGESQYLINGNQVRLLDIIDLVLKAGIGTSRYTVIGQGTVDQMILSGPGEVKNLIDEASGVKGYYIKRERTLRRLEQTAQNLMRAEDLLKEIEPRLKSLRRQAKKMQARAEIENELKIFQRQFFGKLYWDIRKVLDAQEKLLAESQVKKNHLESQILKEQEEAKKLENLAGGQNQKLQILRDDLNSLQAQKNRILEDLSLVRGKMQSQKTAGSFDPKTLQVEVHNKQRQIDEITAKINQGKEHQTKAGQNLSAEQKFLSELSQKLEKLYGGAKNPAQIDWALFDLEFRALEKQLDDFLKALESGENLEAVKVLSASLKKGFEKFKAVVQAATRGPERDLAAFQKELAEALAQKDVANKAVLDLQLDLSKNKVQLDFFQKELVRLEQEKLHFDLELKKVQSQSPDEFWQSLAAEEKKIQEAVNVLGGQIAQAESHLAAYYQQEEQKRKQLREKEKQLHNLEQELGGVKDRDSAALVEKAKSDTQMQLLLEEVRGVLGETAVLGMAKHRPAETPPDLEQKILRLKNQLDMIGGMDELTLKEYQETETRHSTLSNQVNDLKKSMQDLRGIMDELDEHIKNQFHQSFHKINEQFEKYFRLLFNGGRAYLSVIKAEANAGEGLKAAPAEDAYEDENKALRPEEKVVRKYEKGPSDIVGIDIKATPAGKKLAHIQALSGGERSLTSIALLCSLLTCFPSPFVVLDEVDAALDDANTIRFSQILGQLANQTQFVTITHNRETMAHAHTLYGVTMGDDGVSKLLSVKLEQAKAYAK